MYSAEKEEKTVKLKDFPAAVGARRGRCALTAFLMSAAVFAVFAYTASLARFNVLDFHPNKILPAIQVYIADYSIGFSTRLLIGAITRLFSFTLTMDQLYHICAAAVLISLVMLSVLCGIMLMKCLVKGQIFALFIAALFVLNPVISQDNYHIFGSFDTYWLILFILLTAVYKNGSFPLFALLLSVIGLLIHFGWMFTYLPAVMALLLYGFFMQKDRKKKIFSGVSFLVTGVTSVGLFLYFLIYGSQDLKMDQAGFHEYLLSRLSLDKHSKFQLSALYGEAMLPFEFMEYYFFNSGDGHAGGEMTMSSTLSVLREHAAHGTAEIYLGYAADFVPLLLLFAVLWFACAKREKGVKKLPYICFAGIQLVVIPAIMMSTDVWRWAAAVMISQFGILCALVFVRDENLEAVLKAPVWKKWYIVVPLLIAGGFYTAYMFKFGVHLPKFN